MKNFRCVIFIYVGIISCILFSCNNEDDITVNTLTGLKINADFLKLVDNGTDVAGELSISSQIEDIQLIWNTDSLCNLETSQTVISPRNGKCTLPIKWQKEVK